MSVVFISAVVAAYLMGAAPFAQIIAKLHGKDLRTVGSGNIGATNLARACGRKWGYICFGLDVLKGLVPVVAFPIVAKTDTASAGFFAMWLAVGIAAILGHVFPVYLNFRGGKGVATSFGVALGVWPYFTVCAVIALLVWVACVLKWRYISLASICAGADIPGHAGHRRSGRAQLGPGPDMAAAGRGGCHSHPGHHPPPREHRPPPRRHRKQGPQQERQALDR